MPATRTERVLSVRGLLDHPGRSRPLDLELAPPDGLDLPLVAVDGDLGLHGVLESVVDGVLVRGDLVAPLSMACARCLAPMDNPPLTVPVVEHFADPARAEDPADVEPGYVVLDEAIDLDILLRDALVAAVPIAPHCRPDCAGLCPMCGVDRNVTACVCGTAEPDRRWAALEGLRLDGDSG